MKVTLFRDLPSEGWHSMERYADELTRALHALDKDVQPFVAPRPVPQLRGKIGVLANYAWRSIAYPMHAARHQNDINHIIDHSYAHLIHALDPHRTIVTCHDIAPLAFDRHGRGLSYRLWLRSFQAMLRAEHILADSTHTRDAILTHSTYAAECITVVPLGVTSFFFERGLDSRILRERHLLRDRPIVLHIGSCQPRKNVEALLQALSALHDLDIIFVQVGGRFTVEQHSLIAKHSLNVLQLQSVSEDELRTWYQSAQVFVFPSLYEGFGLPVLEAMACGIPVICADATSLPEVAGDAAHLVDPHDPRKLSEAIRAVLTDLSHAQDLSQRGIAHARTFTWQRCARETLAVYQRVFES